MLSGHEAIHVCSFVKVKFSRGLLYTLSFDIIFHIDYVMIRFADRGHPLNSIDRGWRICSCTGMYHWFECHLPGAVVSQGISRPNAENCSGFPPPLDSRRLRSRIA